MSHSRIHLTVRDLNLAGEGIGTDPTGLTVFVPDLLPGESGPVAIHTRRKQFASARLVGPRTVTSPDRIQPRCPIAGRCGACTLQHWSYPAQLAWKTRQVQQALIRIGKLPEARVRAALSPCRGMETAATGPWSYRSKIQIPFAPPLQLGYYQQNSHRVLETTRCYLQPPVADTIREAVRTYCEARNISVYDEATCLGLLRHLVLRLGFGTGEVLLVLVLHAPKAEAGRLRAQFEGLAAWVQAAMQAARAKEEEAHSPETTAETEAKTAAETAAKDIGPDFHLKSVQLNFQPRANNTILGPDCLTLWGTDSIQERLGGLNYKISPLSFFQVNPQQTEILYRLVCERAALTGQETVFDLYCGTGSISLWLARQARRVYGIEIVPAAIADARENAMQNGLSERTDFRCGPAEVLAPELVAAGVRPDVVVLDPPRKGCDSRLLTTVLQVEPTRLVYVSCNPATLARDLEVLTRGGYVLQSVEPVDLFPHTTHVETVCLLTR